MTTTQDANAFLMAGGVPSAKFDTIGTVVSGTITTDPDVRQQTALDGTPLVWDNGEPRREVVVTIDTGHTDPSIPNDDGARRLYIKGNLLAAVRQAIRDAGAPGLAVGGRLDVKFTGEEPPRQRGWNPTKLYAARYVPPAASQADVWDTPPAAATAPAPRPTYDEPPF
jgi:hypothetical protein